MGLSSLFLMLLVRTLRRSFREGFRFCSLSGRNSTFEQIAKTLYGTAV